MSRRVRVKFIISGKVAYVDEIQAMNLVDEGVAVLASKLETAMTHNPKNAMKERAGARG